tara:strand:+ start:867 stop:1079 length:213 start_codon:yes stop_codon:yes gene_type:complete
MKGVPHYTKSGTLFTGKTHKMKDGSLHSGATHTKSSKPLVHFKDLSKGLQKKLLVKHLQAKAKMKKGGKA